MPHKLLLPNTQIAELHSIYFVPIRYTLLILRHKTFQLILQIRYTNA